MDWDTISTEEQKDVSRMSFAIFGLPDVRFYEIDVVQEFNRRDLAYDEDALPAITVILGCVWPHFPRKVFAWNAGDVIWHNSELAIIVQ
ncbi:hypothetical protein P154DRAFT_528012 [Amniculicola lignicola CBS 123094]|uniref:Uncharacterized protein n=1 Tax=Amniculicola lignicola CBS 123094 TaxID=1392246 RepID=A0A6A5VUR4_9PLEO|nr:hypothetical protein P154DRAFT_528012 [Amniculicola lignicola CBS 123094]